MNLTWFDWSLVAVSFFGLIAVAVRVRRYSQGVAAFLSANRLGGRYLLTIADGIAGMGVITFIAQFEKYYQSGFGASFWQQAMSPLWLILGISGWIVYRFRETRAMTMPQFFEMRYSRRFRIFSGALCWVSGVLNYGIFPAVTGRALIYLIGIPEVYWPVPLLGIDLNLTLALVTGTLLTLAVVITLNGGQVAVMVTDFLQGQFTNIVLLLVLILLMVNFSWDEIVDTLSRAPAGQSMLNPFKQSDIPDFNPAFFGMLAFIQFYGYMAWQGNQGYNSSAKTPHEAKMARVLASWRMIVMFLLLMMIPIIAYVMMNSPAYAAEQAQVQAMLGQLPTEQLQKQMTTPAVLTQILPVGVMGLFIAMILFTAISTDDTYLHSWGSIFIQDVVAPLRKTPLQPEQRIRWLRRSIVGVAVFSWFFSLLFPLSEYVFMYQQITGAIFLGGAGAVIIGGLYWSRGSTAGAWAAMISGALLSITGIVCINYFFPVLLPRLKAGLDAGHWIQSWPEKFWLNGMEVTFGSALTSVAVYVIFSLCSPRAPGDLGKLLHRQTEDTGRIRMSFKERLGITPNFTRGDKLIYAFNISWAVLWFVGFVVLTIWQLNSGLSDAQWASWWAFKVGLTVVVGVLTTFWFLIGGFRDLRSLIRDLKATRVDASDDGSV